MNLTKVEITLTRLKAEYPTASSLLNFANPYQALVATILSAQTTDQAVNRITPQLFIKYPDAYFLSLANIEDLTGIIKSLGLYRVKAAHLVAAAREVKENYGGKIPDTFEELLHLPGVGRKTANVVLANAFGKPGLGVDTHVHRVSNRIGLAASKDPSDTETQLKAKIPENDWGKAHHLLIFHGRQICTARKPRCSSCILRDICAYFQSKQDDHTLQ
jgi:endonuclease-3